MIFLLIPFFIVSTVLLLLGHLSLGEYPVSLSVIFKFDEIGSKVLWEHRMPRFVCGYFVGGSLSLSGALLQGMFRNPLASPGIIGASSGAMLGAIISLFLGFEYYLYLSGFSFFGALLVTLAVYLISVLRGSQTSDMVTMILIGVAVTALCSSISSILLTLSLDEWEIGKKMIEWSFGSLENMSWPEIKYFFPLVFCAFTGSLFYIKDLNLMLTGDESASSLGLNLKRSRKGIIVISAVLTGASISISGMIGFIGLIAPHITRLIVGNHYRRLLISSFFMGAFILSASDLLVHYLNVSFKVDIKIGILTSLLGSPFFIYLLLSRKKFA